MFCNIGAYHSPIARFIGGGEYTNFQNHMVYAASDPEADKLNSFVLMFEDTVRNVEGA